MICARKTAVFGPDISSEMQRKLRMGPYSGAFPHKTAAVRAGLGWIGRSALFVSPQFGPRVRLCTVLTDCPLPGAKTESSVSRCKTCNRCVKACPARAISGVEYRPGMSRAELFDPEACSRHMMSVSDTCSALLSPTYRRRSFT